MRAIAEALDDAQERSAGSVLLIEGPAGIGKTRLLGDLRAQAITRGFQVLAARGSEIERDFGFGVVRQLLGTTVAALDADGRARLLGGSDAQAARIFEIDKSDHDDTQAGAYSRPRCTASSGFWSASLRRRRPRS